MRLQAERVYNYISMTVFVNNNAHQSIRQSVEIRIKIDLLKKHVVFQKNKKPSDDVFLI